jgi:hypothetical protein
MNKVGPDQAVEEFLECGLVGPVDSFVCTSLPIPDPLPLSKKLRDSSAKICRKNG